MQWRLGIHRGRVDRETGRFHRKAFCLGREAEFVAHQADEIAGILPVVNGEARRQSDPAGVVAQESRPDAVEGARPGERGAAQSRIGTGVLGDDPIDPPRHFVGRPPREGEQQDPAGVGALGDKMRDPVREGIGLARSGAGDDQQGAELAVVFDGEALLFVQRGQIVLGRIRSHQYGGCRHF